MRKVNEKAVKIYSYGALPPAKESADAVEGQFKAARRYRNRLIAIDRAYRETRSKIYLKHPAYAQAEATRLAADQAVEAEIAAVRKLNQIARSKSSNETACAPHITALKQVLRPRLYAAERAVWEAQKEAQALPEIQKEISELLRYTNVGYRLARQEAVRGVTKDTLYQTTERYWVQTVTVESEAEKQIQEMLVADPYYISVQKRLQDLKQVKGKAAKEVPHKRALALALTAMKSAKSVTLKKPENEKRFEQIRATLKQAREEIDNRESKIPVDLKEVGRPCAALGWGTAAIVRETHKAMEKSLTPPKYEKWDGGGRIGLQFGDGGLPLSEIFSGTNSFLRIDQPPETAYLPRTEPKPEPDAVSPEIQALLNKRNALRKARAKRVDIEAVQDEIRKLRSACDPAYAAYRDAVLRLRKAKGTPDEEAAREHLRETRRACSAATPDGFNSPKRERRTELQMCIGKGTGDLRPFVKFPIIMHRELPPDSVLKWAWIIKRKVALSYKYDFQVVIESDSFAARLPEIDPRPRCAIDIGWRHKNNTGNRVGYFYDSEGVHGEIVIPSVVHEGLEKANSLRSIQDRNFTEVLDRLLAWREKATLPEWWEKKCKLLGGWRSSARLGEVVLYWEKHRFSGDETIFDTMKAWRKQWVHLYQWETHETRNALNRRKNFFRETAKVFAEKYSTIVWEKIDLAEIGKKKARKKAKKGSDPDDTLAPAGKRRVQTAPGEFRELLQSAATTRAVHVAPEYTTIKCSWCGEPNDFDHRVLMHTCTKCGERWDQDHNAARNILEAASAPEARSQSAA